MVKSKGVLVLASQTLAEFVDIIDCTMDLALCWQDQWQESSRNTFILYTFVGVKVEYQIDINLKLMSKKYRNSEKI